MNIRRYVDNTPDEELEDVQAHLMGGIPWTEIRALQGELSKLCLEVGDLFCDSRPQYLAFVDSVFDKAAIKTLIDEKPAVKQILEKNALALKEWWGIAQIDFAALCDGKKMPEVRDELLHTIKNEIDSLEYFG